MNRNSNKYEILSIDDLEESNKMVSRFKNIDGVSCYMVSILHIIQQIEFFTNFLIKDISKFNNNLTYQLARLLKTSLEHDNIVIGPKSFKQCAGKKNSLWVEIEQQDSQEFYNFLIGVLEEECGTPYTVIDRPGVNESLKLIGTEYIYKAESKDYSIIKDIFIGYLISNIKCALCDSNSPNFEAFVTLPICIPVSRGSSVDTPYTLEQCLDNFISDEELSNDNQIECDSCKNKNQSIKKIQIWKPPKVLVFQLKRFITNSFGQQTAKIINPIVYPVENFDISNYIHPESPYKNHVNKYNLLGVNIHKEIGFGSINHGHYISYVKNIVDNEWYIFDDADELEKIDKDSIQNRNAYLLFYIKLE